MGPWKILQYHQSIALFRFLLLRRKDFSVNVYKLMCHTGWSVITGAGFIIIETELSKERITRCSVYLIGRSLL